MMQSGMMNEKKENLGRTGNARRNIYYGLMQVVVSQLLPFIVRTILIDRFGVAYLGLNSLFASVLSVLSLMELGFGTAVVYSMYKPVAEGNTQQVCAYLSCYRKIYRYIGLAILAAGLLLMPFLKNLIHDPALPGDLNLYACYLIFLGDTVISYLLFGYLTAVPTAYQRRDLLSKADMGISVLQCIVRSMLLLYSGNFYFYLLSIPAMTILRNLVIARIIRERYPELKCAGQLEENQKKDLKKRVHGLVIEKITAASRNSIDTLCISAFIGLAVCGLYNNYFYIMTGMIAFSTTVLSAVMASVGNSIASETREKNYRDMRLFDFIYTAVAGWAAVCMLCLYQPFVRAWLGTDMMLETPVVLGLCAYFYILKSGDVRWVYHEGAGLWYESRWIMLGEAAVNVLLNILLCKALGVFGIVLATVISVFITNAVFCPRLLFWQYFRNGKLKEYRKDHIGYSGTMLITAGLSWMVCEYVLPMGLVDRGAMQAVLCLVGRLMVCSALAVAVFWLFWHRSERYTGAAVWLKRIARTQSR